LLGRKEVVLYLDAGVVCSYAYRVKAGVKRQEVVDV